MDNHQTQLAREVAELAAYPTLLLRAATTGNHELYKSLLKDAIDLCDELEIETLIAARKQRIAGTPEQLFQIGMRQGADIIKSEARREAQWRT